MPRRRAFLAVPLLLGLASAIAGVIGWRHSGREVAEAELRARELAEQAVSFTIAGIEHAMLQGKGVMIKQLVERFHARVPDVEIHIYDNLGYEVFKEPPPPPPRTALPAEVVKILDGGPGIAMPDGRVLRPIADEDRCHTCHVDEKALRGVLEIRPQPDVLARDRATITPSVIKAAFVNVMTSEHAYMLDDFFNQLQANAPTLRAVGVYGNDALLRFGTQVPGVTADDLNGELVADAKPITVTREGRAVTLIPLPREQRCATCHKKDTKPIRGVLAVSMDTVTKEAAVVELQTVIDNSIRVIMMSSLGRMIIKLLRGVAETGAITDVILYDNAGRTYVSPAPSTPPPTVKAMLADPTRTSEDLPAADGRVLLARTLANEGKCITCHGTDSKIRGVVTMSLSRPSDDLHGHAMRETTLFTAVAVVGGLLVLLALIGFRATRRQPS